jgi:hypothetical protein
MSRATSATAPRGTHWLPFLLGSLDGAPAGPLGADIRFHLWSRKLTINTAKYFDKTLEPRPVKDDYDQRRLLHVVDNPGTRDTRRASTA